MAANSENGMSRLQELWEWQRKRKEQGGNTAARKMTKGSAGTNTSKSKTTNSSAKSSNLPRYMQPTEAAKLRQGRDKAETGSSANKSMNRSSNDLNKSSTAKVTRRIPQPTVTSKTGANTTETTRQATASRAAENKPGRPTVASRTQSKLTKPKERTIPGERKVLRPTRASNINTNVTKNVNKPTVKKTDKLPAKVSKQPREKTVPVEPKVAKDTMDTKQELDAVKEDVVQVKTRIPRKLPAGMSKPQPQMIPQQKRGRSPAPSPDTSAEEDVENTTDSPVPRRPSTAKRQRTDAGPPLDIAAPDFDQDDDSGSVLMSAEATSTIHKSSFAPENTQFTFSQPLTPQTLRFISSSGQSNLESIAENDDSEGTTEQPAVEESSDDVFSKSAETALPADLSLGDRAVQTPARTTRQVSGDSIAPNQTTPVCKYETIHTYKNHKLSEKMRKAMSPDEKLQILSQSPMIEISRNKSKTCSWRSASPVPDINMDVTCGSTDAPVTSQTDGAQTQSGSQSDPVKKDVEYFKNKVIENTDILEGMAVKWDKITEGLVDVSEEVSGEIRTTSCQGRLIIAERFHQFSGLISQCENKTGDKPVLEEDLEGFWDMIYFQVEDVLAKFVKLDKLRENNWVQVEEKKALPAAISLNKVVKKKSVKPVVKSKGPSKFAAFRKQMAKKQLAASNIEDIPVTIDMAEPNKTPKQTTTKTPRRSTRKASVSATPDQNEERTFAFRRSTMELTMESSSKRPRQTPDGNLRNVALRTASGKKSLRRRSVSQTAKPPVLEELASPALSNTALSSLADNTHTADIKHTTTDSIPGMSAQKSVRMSAVGLDSPVTASPDLMMYLGNSAYKDRQQSRVSLIRPQKSCSPSPLMVRAMMSASKSGKKSKISTPLGTCEERSKESTSLENSLLDYLMPTSPCVPGSSENSPSSPKLRRGRRSVTQSLHKHVLTKKFETPSNGAAAATNVTPVTSDIFSPAGSLDKLNLNDSNTSEHDVVHDLVVFSPMPQTPTGKDNGPAPLVTPRRSTRIASKRVSLL